MKIALPYESNISRWTSPRVWQLYFIAACFGLLVVPPIFAFYEYSFVKALLAVALLSVCLYPTARYFARHEGGLPVLPVLCLSYALQFAFPIFTNEPTIRLAFGEIKYLEDDYVIAVLQLSILGVGALQFGYYILQSSKLIQVFPTIDLHLNEKKAVIYCVAVGIFLPAILGVRDIISEEQYQQFSSIFTLLQNQQLVVIGILGWIVYSGRGASWHRLLLYCIVGITTWRGVSSGFLEQTIIPVILLFVTKWLYGKRLSVLSLATIIAVILFLSPAKASFRQAVWFDSGKEVNTSEFPFGTASLWVEQATQYWIETLSGERELFDATSSATSRTDLLHQFAHIYSLTPEIIPYQYGGTYSYFAVALIPRAIWTDKPEAGTANNYFAVAYNITTEEGVKRATFGISLLGEGYVNFGIPGVAFIMAFQGAVLILLQQGFGTPKSGAGGRAVLLAFFVFFLNGVGTSAEIFFGNIAQNLISSCALLWWAREKPSVRRRVNMKLVRSLSLSKSSQ